MKRLWLLFVFLLPLALLAQADEAVVDEPVPPPDAVISAQAGHGPVVFTKRIEGPDEHNVFFYRTMPNEGRWWKNSELVKQVGVSDQQVKQIEKIFEDSRIPLIDAKAELERQEVRLEPLMEADNPNDQQIASQIDKVASARAQLEKAHALMLVAIRRVLTVDQWKKLQSLQPGPGPMKMTMPLPPLPPGAQVVHREVIRKQIQK